MWFPYLPAPLGHSISGVGSKGHSVLDHKCHKKDGKHDIFHPVKMLLCNFPNINQSSFRNPAIALCDSSTFYL